MGVDELTDYLANQYELNTVERDLLYWLLRGHDNAEIGYELGKSEQTIKNQVTTMLVKFGIEKGKGSRSKIQGMAIEYLCGEENEDARRQKK